MLSRAAAATSAAALTDLAKGPGYGEFVRAPDGTALHVTQWGEGPPLLEGLKNEERWVPID
jgi:hypothetical protein